MPDDITSRMATGSALRQCHRLALLIGLAALFLIWAKPIVASETAMLCERAALAAAQSSGVPLDVLRAIALNETGRSDGNTLRPWPWAVNMQGKGYWFQSRREALDFVQTRLSEGAVSFDVGCFQINYRWHGHAFASLFDMFDPAANARYAADFLSRLHAETGDWSVAAGAYHSRTPEYAARYRARFDRIRASLPPPDNQEMLPETAILANSFPLLVNASPVALRLGSLVPLAKSSTTTRLIALE